MEIVSSILPTFVGTLIAGLVFLFIARKADRATIRVLAQLVVVMVLGSTLTEAAKIELSITSTLGSVALGAVVGVVVATIVVGAMVILGVWKKAKSTDV